MKALVVVPGGVEVVDHPDPEPPPDGVVVAVHSCGICGSDVHSVEVGSRRRGQILGHELSGTVAEVGRNARAAGWRHGQAVAVNPLGGCGTCGVCGQGLPFLCDRMPNLGLTAPGGFAEYLAVPQAQLFPLPEGVDVELGAHAEPLAVALHAVGLARAAPGADALVFGVGPIGLNVIAALRASGAGRIVAVGRSAGRRAAAAALGADIVLDARETNVAEYAAAEGLRFPQAYECSAAPEALALCAPTLAVGGTVVEVALPSTPASVDTRLFVGRNLHLVGSCAFGVEEYRRAVELLCSASIDVAPLVSERVPLAGAPDALERLRHPVDLVGVLVQPWR
ncbi:MAG TPA: alcohol dehydrogenase catalytic domain-containing protein [Candidatus Dormibacteraeota bacterium]|nr:alcohol dehydrogenase catalytic domain-containing protein [Candidatus Dormibacteraeota bacterium]